MNKKIFLFVFFIFTNLYSYRLIIKNCSDSNINFSTRLKVADAISRYNWLIMPGDSINIFEPSSTIFSFQDDLRLVNFDILDTLRKIDEISLQHELELDSDSAIVTVYIHKYTNRYSFKLNSSSKEIFLD